MKRLILFCLFFFAFIAVSQAKQITLQKQIADCEKIGYPQWRDDCFENLQHTAKAYAVCLKIINTERRKACLDTTLPKNSADCLLHKKSPDSDACLQQLKDLTHNLSFCKKIKDLTRRKACYNCPSPDNKKEENICFEFLAKQQQDESICDLIGTKSGKIMCLSEMLSKPSSERCAHPSNIAEFKLCKQLALAQVQQKDNVKKIADSPKEQEQQSPHSQIESAKFQQSKTKRIAKINKKTTQSQKIYDIPDNATKVGSIEKSAESTPAVNIEKTVPLNKNACFLDDPIK